MECGEDIERAEDESEESQRDWYTVDDELKLCNSCALESSSSE